MVNKTHQAIRCPDCKTVNDIPTNLSHIPLRELFCERCHTALELDNPASIELKNFIPADTTRYHIYKAQELQKGNP